MSNMSLHITLPMARTQPHYPVVSRVLMGRWGSCIGCRCRRNGVETGERTSDRVVQTGLINIMPVPVLASNAGELACALRSSVFQGSPPRRRRQRHDQLHLDNTGQSIWNSSDRNVNVPLSQEPRELR